MSDGTLIHSHSTLGTNPVVRSWVCMKWLRPRNDLKHSSTGMGVSHSGRKPGGMRWWGGQERGFWLRLYFHTCLPHFLVTCQARIWPMGLSTVPFAQRTTLLPWGPWPGTGCWAETSSKYKHWHLWKSLQHTLKRSRLLGIAQNTYQEKCSNKQTRFHNN